MSKVIYLASPYSSASQAMMESRYLMALAATITLMKHKDVVYSPIVHSRPVALSGELSHDWDFWQHFDLEMLSRCDMLYVLCIPGWQLSVGVQAEIEAARKMGKPVMYFYNEGEVWSLQEAPDEAE